MENRPSSSMRQIVPMVDDASFESSAILKAVALSEDIGTVQRSDGGISSNIIDSKTACPNPSGITKTALESTDDISISTPDVKLEILPTPLKENPENRPEKQISDSLSQRLPRCLSANAPSIKAMNLPEWVFEVEDYLMNMP